ncbi:hypothetical protein [Moorena sp. SIO4G3]|uniref:hypothetical protein n=1 Tax=Moorena sp. SIO4G3 TaxID=2607821 RepID=UPI00142A2729|nr:hypothetical protein [Moorena sp. SIO4G3]NEO81551.1 hypothetical protein [Moorena sp. SIO4G3]
MRGISSFVKGEFCVEFSPVLTIPDSRFPIPDSRFPTPDSLKIFFTKLFKICYNIAIFVLQ